jgi:hypothetical protein
LEKISKQEMSYLIQKKILIQKRGNYGDNLIVTGKFGNGRGKQRYLTVPLYNYLLRLKEKDKIELVDLGLDNVKENQKYLIDSNNKKYIVKD